jgi:Mg-chelatase subunit ChlD
MLVLDRGANIPSQAFISAETALESFVGTLQFPSDEVGVASFTTSATVNQTLTNNPSLAINAFSEIIPGGGISYIGSGIAAAQGEFASPRNNPAATPVLLLISDGADLGAPNSSATLTAANAAKAAGIEIISVQYGTGPTTLMQSIASSSANFYQVTQ